MTKSFLLFISAFFLSASCFSQKIIVDVFMDKKAVNPTGDTIYYDPARPLTWNDFKGDPDYDNPGGAITASGFAFDADISIRQDVIHLKIAVYTFFSKSNSWKKPQINSAYHLLHEQNHFSITRLGTENFIKAVASANYTKDNYKKLTASIFDKLYAETVARQQLYDKETNHSINSDAQLQWNERIAGEIKDLYAK